MPLVGVLQERDNTYGCLFIVAVFSTALWSLSCLQLSLYIERFVRTDKLWLILYTVALWILSTIYLILVLKFLYVYFVKEFGNTSFLENLPKDIHVAASLSPVICAMVQALFVMRAWILSNRNYFWTGSLALSVVAQLVSTIVFIHKLRNYKYLSDVLEIIAYERAMNIITIFTDTVIAVSLVCLLRRHRCGSKRGDWVLRRLFAFIIGTGLITGVMAILAFITTEVLPQTFIYITVDFCMAKLYYNCMLASLNARSAIRKEMNATIVLSIHLDDLECSSSGEDAHVETS